jgi:hypothetical protein
MKRAYLKTVALASLSAVALTLALPVSASAASFKEVQETARKSTNWGLYTNAKNAYLDFLKTPEGKHHNKARIALAELYLQENDLRAAKGILEEIHSPSKKDKKKARKLNKKIDAALKPHKLGGNLKMAFATDANVSVAGKGTGPGPESFDDDEEEGDEDEEDDGFGDGFEDDDTLDDVLDDLDLDDEDLDEQDGDPNDFFDEGADLDGDGTPDAAEVAADAGAGDGAGADAGGDTGGAEALRRFSARGGKKFARDERFASALGANYRYVFNGRGDSLNVSGVIGQSAQIDQDQLNRYNYAVNVGPVFNVPPLRLKFNPSITYLNLYKDDEETLDTWVASLNLKHTFNQYLSFGIRYNLENRDFVDEDAPELEVDTLKLVAEIKPTKKDKLKIGIMPKWEDSGDDGKDRSQEGFEFAYARKLPFYKMYAQAKFRYVEFDFDNSPRVDDETKYSLTLGRKFGPAFVNLTFEDKDRESSLGRGSNNQSFILGTGLKF